MITSHLIDMRVSLDISISNLKANCESSRERSALAALYRAIEWVDAELIYRAEVIDKQARKLESHKTWGAKI